MAGIRHALSEIVPPRIGPGKPGEEKRIFRAVYTLGAVADATVQLRLEGLQAEYPGVGTPTALSPIGRDRLIPRGASESDEAYSERLLAWRDAHRRAGNPYLEMQQIQSHWPDPAYLQVVNAHSCWYELNKDGEVSRTLPIPANWDWDGVFLKARVWLIIYPPTSLFQRDLTWANTDNSTWDDDPNATWGSTATVQQIQDIRNLLEHWRSSGAFFEHILVGFADLPLDPNDTNPPLPDGQWGQYSKLDASGNCIQARSEDFIYWRGTT
ncbi:MAG: hypothetical protein H6718_04065 [Polyangiaceae bacterium]|nr:hypothetical protein [Polyangiaceae bacterium]